jgi:hypothetical protein
VPVHGGSIAVDSEPGRGTAFTITVPFGSAHWPKERIGDAHRGPAGVRAQAYVEEALSWLPRDNRGGAADGALTRSILDDFDAPVPLAAPGRVLLADDSANCAITSADCSSISITRSRRLPTARPRSPRSAVRRRTWC